MKISISITGQFRKYKSIFPSVVNFCNNYNIDIFLLIDNREKEEEILDIISLSNPVDVKYVDSLDDCANINMWYKIQKGYEQIKEYENMNNFKYDFYIRCRYDVLITSFNVDFNQLNKNTLYFGKRYYMIGWDPDIFYNILGYCRDEFFMSGEKNMNIYCNLYDILIHSNNRCLEYTIPEAQFYYLVKFNFTETKTLNIKYRWACFSDRECLGYHYDKIKKGVYPVKEIVRIVKIILVMIVIIIILMFFLIKRSITNGGRAHS